MSDENDQEWTVVGLMAGVACPGCGFTFDAGHTNTDGSGYSCPVCDEIAMAVDVRVLMDRLIGSHHPTDAELEAAFRRLYDTLPPLVIASTPTSTSEVTR